MTTPSLHAAASSAGLDIEDVPEVLAQGGDWDDVIAEIERINHERVVLNMGPVHLDPRCSSLDPRAGWRNRS